MKKEILIGKQGNDKVILEVELKDNKQSKGKITTLLTPAPINYKTLSISGSIGNHSFGQIYDSIMPWQLDELYVDRDWLIKLLAIWKAAHLNDLNAGTELQSDYVEFWRANYKQGNQYDYTEACQMLKQHHLLIDNETNPELTVGYKYGSLWLVRLLPDSIEDFFNSLAQSDPTTTRSNILDYILEHDYTWRIQSIDSNPHMKSDTPMDHWKITLIRETDQEFETYFSTGFGHRLSYQKHTTKHNIQLQRWANEKIKMLGHKPTMKWRNQMKELGFSLPPTRLQSMYTSMKQEYEGLRVPPMPDQVIECILSDWLSIENYNSWDDWAVDLGYDLEFKDQRRNAKKAYNTIIEQSEEAQCFFLSDWSQLIELVY